ncbi:MAG: site-specific DNA-methyltransferase [Sandarakinorhabdus sp.]|nr:site-specific DNA-methyltransferase [Sandarakinorhabdus sp.]
MSEPQNDTNLAASPNLADMRRAQLAELIPDAFSGGKLDVAALKRALGGAAVIEGGERYALTWAGKSDAYKVLQTPSTATLRPERDKSVNFDAAQHVFIEGENLEVLKVLQKAYFGKVKLIYIDPPYNTGSDSFIYPDRFQERKEDYLKRINDLADDGTLMREGFFRKNSKESGHYHSNWLSMMLPRLYISRNLLRDDGVIFVSCDDNEVNNLRCLMNEVFGEENFLGVIVWKGATDNNPTQIAVEHEYFVCYARQKSSTEPVWKDSSSAAKLLILKEYQRLRDQLGNEPESIQTELRRFIKANEESLQPITHYNRVDKRGVYTGSRKVHNPKPGGYLYDVPHKDTGKICVRPANGYRYPQERLQELIDADRILYGEDETQIIQIKEYLDDYEGKLSSVVHLDSRTGANDLAAVFEQRQIFTNPKPVDLLANVFDFVLKDGDLVVDFFGGSCTTFEAVIDLNSKDGKARRAICVQLPEPTDEGSEGRKAGFEIISDIGRERFRRVVERAQARGDLANPAPEGLGFRSFLLAPSNFKQWRGDAIDTPEQLAEQMQMFAKSEKEGAAVEDMLYELLLKFGQELATPIEPLAVAGSLVFAIHDRKMLFILDSFTQAMIMPLVKMKPREIIAIDGVFNDSDMLKTNLDLQCRDAGIRFTCL